MYENNSSQSNSLACFIARRVTSNLADSDARNQVEPSLHDFQLIGVIVLVPFGIIVLILLFCWYHPSFVSKLDSYWLVVRNNANRRRGRMDMMDSGLRRQRTVTESINEENAAVARKRHRLLQSFEDHRVYMVSRECTILYL